jgi:nitrate/nitrite transporter NarK
MPASSQWSVNRQRVLFMLGLIFAGEAVYALPFHVARYFRSTVLDVFGMTATELGAAQGVYGIVAMLAYVPGGLVADRFPARKLLAYSLWSTAIGGLYMATSPGYIGSLLLWSFFGISSILLLWAALIRATRDWGGVDEQGRAYGLLDGGRGLFAAALASIFVMSLGLSFPDGLADAPFDAKERALGAIILGYTAVTALTGLLVWFVIPDLHPRDPGERTHSDRSMPEHLVEVLRIRAVWLQAFIVVCAYVAYKGFDNYQLFAVQAYGLDPVYAAAVVTLGSWVRPIAALAAGLLGDRFNVSRILLLCFLLLLVSDLFFGLTTPPPGVAAAWILLGNTLIACIAIFGFRGLYFALFEETRVPVALTGAAVGVVSVIGYTPDIFVTLVAGVFIDASPGLAGHQHFFLFLAAFAALGAVTSLLLMRMLHPREALA